VALQQPLLRGARREKEGKEGKERKALSPRFSSSSRVFFSFLFSVFVLPSLRYNVCNSAVCPPSQKREKNWAREEEEERERGE
jgi:hypothetical protein